MRGVGGLFKEFDVINDWNELGLGLCLFLVIKMGFCTLLKEKEEILYNAALCFLLHVETFIKFNHCLW